MLEKNKPKKSFPAVARLLVFATAGLVLAVGTAMAQDTPPVFTQSAPGSSAILLGKFGDRTPSLATPASVGRVPWQGIDAPTGAPAGSVTSNEGKPVRSDRIRRITLEQVKQQAVDPVANPFAHLGQLSIEAARQHRLGVQADYFPKIGATIANLHFSEFLGDVLSVHRPIAGSTLQVPIPLFSQDMTIAAVTFVQPITPLFKVYQAVQIARADERIAMAKAGAPVARHESETQLEETYFRLLIAQRQSISAEFNLRNAENRPMYASTSSELVRAPDPAPELLEAKKALLTASTKVRELTVSLNRVMAWPDDTELDLVLPAPLEENISFQEVAGKSADAANLDVIEAEQTVIKARAASVISKLDYVPTVAAVGGFMFQNAIPLVPNNFGYGGVLVSYNLFDFGKRERAVKEAHAQLGMAEVGLQLTKAKVAANIKKTYFELEGSRQLSQLAQKMGSSVVGLIHLSSPPESMEIEAARAKLEAEMLEADLAHRQAYASLKALMGPSN
jgi:outer membrane protein